MCESGGNYSALNPSSGAGGAYQILPSTWELYGGQGEPQNAPKAEQDRIAAEIWADSGSGAWVCGCLSAVSRNFPLRCGKSNFSRTTIQLFPPYGLSMETMTEHRHRQAHRRAVHASHQDLDQGDRRFDRVEAQTCSMRYRRSNSTPNPQLR